MTEPAPGPVWRQQQPAVMVTEGTDGSHRPRHILFLGLTAPSLTAASLQILVSGWLCAFRTYCSCTQHR